jgi:hypothetical protein
MIGSHQTELLALERRQWHHEAARRRALLSHARSLRKEMRDGRRARLRLEPSQLISRLPRRPLWAVDTDRC